MSFHTVAKHALTVYYDGDAKLAGKVLDGIAHELAEEIRTELAEKVSKLGVWELRTVSTAQHAADLIDPEVSK